MIYVGLDDTDMIDTPGTNKLARHLAEVLNQDFRCRMIVRHQLLIDPRVPCTRKNGCASLLLEPLVTVEPNGAGLVDQLRPIIRNWSPPGSDPGLCVANQVPEEVIQWGRRCKRELVTQVEARHIAASAGIELVGLGGTHDGVIGALAAVGLAATKNDGRVVYIGGGEADVLDVTGSLSVEEIVARRIEEVRDVDTNEPFSRGEVLLGKRLRPNYRGGHAVLFVARQGDGLYEAVRVP
jgi:hypothetical protein